MIPTIGIMIGCYVFTRMLSLASRAGERQENLAVRIFAVITAIVAVFGMIGLLQASSSFPGPMPR